jgi:hypothetical protein
MGDWVSEGGEWAAEKATELVAELLSLFVWLFLAR